MFLGDGCVREQDPAPKFGPATDADGKYQTRTIDMDQIVLVTMGALKQYTVHSYDENCLDEIDIGVQGQLPPGAVMAPQKRAPSPVACQFPSAKQSVSRTLEWLAPPNYGGNVSEICFTATDVKGSCYGREGESSGGCEGAGAVEGGREEVSTAEV